MIEVEREGGWRLDGNPLSRSRRTIRIDLKQAEGVALVRDLAKSCDGLIEGYRPGVMERLGLAPDVLLADHPALVYGRMTGWGQEGPLAGAAGHDINYLALSGTLHTIGREGRPSPPVNYVGDFGGGGMLLAFAMVSALLAVKNGAPGQVIDCAMTDGSALLASLTWGLYGKGLWKDETGANAIDSGSAWYDTYETADGKWIALGRDRAAILRPADREARPRGGAGRSPASRSGSPNCSAPRDRDQWCALLEGSDACFAPVLALAEAPDHPHNRARSTFVELDGVIQPAPAPRYSRTGDRSARIAAPGRRGAARRARLRRRADRGAQEGRHHRLSRAACQARCSAMKVEMK